MFWHKVKQQIKIFWTLLITIHLTAFRVLTASIPDSCMPILMTTTLSTCQRTESSSSSFHTDSVSTEHRERCSSCISSISAWMLHLALYCFRAERQMIKKNISITSQGEKSTGEWGEDVIQFTLQCKITLILSSSVITLTCDCSVDIILLNQQVPRALWKPWQQQQLDESRDHHH